MSTTKSTKAVAAKATKATAKSTAKAVGTKGPAGLATKGGAEAEAKAYAKRWTLAVDNATVTKAEAVKAGKASSDAAALVARAGHRAPSCRDNWGSRIDQAPLDEAGLLWCP